MSISRLAAVAGFVLCAATVGSAKAANTATAPPMMTLTQHQVMTTVHQFVDNFNAGNISAALATCASPAAIIDEVAPHQWQGPTACADWARDLATSDRSSGITDGKVTLGIPWQVTVSGSHAYVVLPVTYAYKQHGKPGVESGSVWTLVLQKNGSTWRITGWTWAAHA